MPEHPVEAVIFDCDGTLVDSEKVSIAVLVELIAEQGLSLSYEQALAEFSGSELTVVFRSIEQQLRRPLPDDFMQCFRDRQMRVMGQQVVEIPGATELLQSVAQPMCVASNAPMNKIHLCLETTGLRSFFADELIFSAYDIEVWKPAPDLFLQAATALGVAPERCAVVEDSGFGVDAGLAAGMQVFAYDPSGRWHNHDQVTSVSSLQDLIPLF